MLKHRSLFELAYRFLELSPEDVAALRLSDRQVAVLTDRLRRLDGKAAEGWNRALTECQCGCGCFFLAHWHEEAARPRYLSPQHSRRAARARRRLRDRS